eukprot:11912319-Alexandrium_andersonii.AAC.1
MIAGDEPQPEALCCCNKDGTGRLIASPQVGVLANPNSNLRKAAETQGNWACRWSVVVLLTVGA